MDEIELNENNEQKKRPKEWKVFLACIISIVVISAVFCILFIIIPENSSQKGVLTYENYLKIENGMSYNEVKSILGGYDGELYLSSGTGTYSLTYYAWTNTSGTRNIIVGFENNRVCAKSQFGLT